MPPRKLVLVLSAALALSTTTAAPVSAAGPIVGTAPTITLRTGTYLSLSGIPLLVKWPVATAPGAPLHHYELEFSRDAGAWAPVKLSRPLARSASVRRAPWGVLVFRVRAVDQAGAAGEWVESEPAWLSVVQEADPALSLSPDWQAISASSAFGGSRAITTAAGATAEVTFTGRQVIWVARYGPTAGEADVSLDDGPATHIDLRRKAWRPRRVAFRATWPASGEHTLKITTTEPGNVVDIDAFVVLDAARDATLVGAGDVAGCSYTTDSATATVAAEVEGIVFTAGDNVYPDGAAANYENCYEPAWGALKERTRPVPGNHDYLNNPGAGPYFEYFGAAAGEPGRGYYAYEAGTWRVYALNSECDSTTCPQQLEWLDRDLSAVPHRCVLALWHRPRFSTGPHGDSPKMDAIWQLLHGHGAEVVLTGHDHNYQRYTPLDASGASDLERGVRQFVIGSGGAGLYAFESDSPLVEARDSSSHGVLRLDLHPGTYSWQFLPVEGATFTDSGTATCH